MCRVLALRFGHLQISLPSILRYWKTNLRDEHQDQLTCVNNVKMAAFVKAINAKIRSNPVTDYVCSTRKFFPKVPG